MMDMIEQAKAESAKAFDAAFKDAVPMNHHNTTLTAEERAHLRGLITKHPAWGAYRSQWAIDASALDRRRVLHFCETAGLDWQTALVQFHEERQKAAEKSNGTKPVTPFTATPADIEAAQKAAKAAEEAEERRALEKHEAERNARAEEQARLQRTSDDAERARMAQDGRKAIEAATPAPEAPTPATPRERPAAPAFAGDAITTAIANVLWTPMFEAIEREMQAAIDAKVGQLPTTIIEVKRPDGSTTKLPATHHPMLPTLIKALSTPMASGYYPNVWIAGPTGSGKTHAASQVAEALGLPFHSQGSMSMAHELLGYQDGHGVYHSTSFRDAYEHGGVMLLDEIDGGDNAAILAINGATANGSCRFPDKTVQRHKDFRLIGAANTWGTGATAEYIGRAKIDSAILSRFPVKLAWNYDTAFEARIVGQDATSQAWVRRVQDARRRAEARKIKVVIDPRVSQAGAALIAGGMTPDMAAAVTYHAGLTLEQINQLEGRA